MITFGIAVLIRPNSLLGPCLNRVIGVNIITLRVVAGDLKGGDKFCVSGVFSGTGTEGHQCALRGWSVDQTIFVRHQRGFNSLLAHWRMISPTSVWHPQYRTFTAQGNIPSQTLFLFIFRSCSKEHCEFYLSHLILAFLRRSKEARQTKPPNK